MWRQARWLGLPPEEIAEKQIWHGDLGNRFAYFRCEKTLPAGCALTLDITANSRYRLWINGRPVLSGPCKGDRFRQYYETVDVTDRLREGKNVFCAQVLYCDPDMAERAYEWFRALEQAGLYGDMRRELEPWIGLLALDCTTCPETPKGARSDCHAWSALPIYELIRTVAGVHVGEDGRVRVAPHTMDLPDLRGQAATLRGPVRFDYRKDEAGRWRYAVTLPEGMTGLFRFPDGSEAPLREGFQCLKA